MKPWAVADGWGLVFVSGIVAGVAASIPALDTWTWRVAVWVAPWLLVVAVPVGVVVGVRWLWKERGW